MGSNRDPRTHMQLLVSINDVDIFSERQGWSRGCFEVVAGNVESTSQDSRQCGIVDRRST